MVRDSLFLYVLFCTMCSMSAMTQQVQRAKLSEAPLAIFLQRLPLDIQKRELIPFFVSESEQSLSIDRQLIPALAPVQLVTGNRRHNNVYELQSHHSFSPIVQNSPLRKLIKNLSVIQIKFIIDLFNARAENIELDAISFDIFDSLPKVIQINLLENYPIKQHPGHIVRVNGHALWPAVCTVPCRAPLEELSEDVRKIMFSEHEQFSLGSRLPLVIKSCSWDAKAKRFIVEEALYEKDHRHVKRRLKAIDLSASDKFPRDASKYLHNLLRNKMQRLERTRNACIIVGLENGKINAYLPRQLIAELEQLSPEQLQFIIALFESMGNQPRELDAFNTRIFCSLPEHMQQNIQRNYPLILHTQTRLKMRYPRMAAFVRKTAGTYAQLSSHKLVKVVKVVGALGALCYCLSILKSSKVQKRNWLIFEPLKESRFFKAF